MSKNDAINRLEFLAEQFKVFTQEEFDDIDEEILNSPQTIIVNGYSNNILALIEVTLKKDSEYEGVNVVSHKRNIKIHENVFISIVQADPTKNKIYIQWLLNVFTKYLKNDKIDEAKRFVEEDLNSAYEYLKLFEDNKRKQLFKALCKSNSELLNIGDPTNINQYKNLEQVFDVIDPFIERDASTLERAFQNFVNLGEAEIPVRDRNFTLYIPKSVNASVVFKNFTNWCTASEGNGMFKTYTSKVTPDGRKSKLYAIIDNNVYSGNSKEMWQIHFETKQLMDRTDKPETSFYDKVLCKSEALSNFFHKELLGFAKLVKGDISNNLYIKYLIDFGHPEALFDVMDENSPTLFFNNKIIPKIPDLNKFKNLSVIFISESRLKELNPSIGGLKNLKVLSLPKNKIEVIPSFIGNCKNLDTINLVGNPIKHIPSEISKLDPSNGGSLLRLSVREIDIGEENYLRLKELLPNVTIEGTLV